MRQSEQAAAFIAANAHAHSAAAPAACRRSTSRRRRRIQAVRRGSALRHGPASSACSRPVPRIDVDRAAAVIQARRRGGLAREQTRLVRTRR